MDSKFQHSLNITTHGNSAYKTARREIAEQVPVRPFSLLFCKTCFRIFWNQKEKADFRHLFFFHRLTTLTGSNVACEAMIQSPERKHCSDAMP